MGQSNSASYERNREKPDPSVAATLYYFEGRGVADQIRLKERFIFFKIMIKFEFF
jgi:hypothetical protein